MRILPIYKDTVFEYTGETLSYRVTLDGAAIFYGKAYAAPGEDTIKININRVCENYLNNNEIEPILAGDVVQMEAPNALRYFALEKTDLGGGLLNEYCFLYNYEYYGTDYYDTTDANIKSLSDPISDGYADPMFPLYTYIQGDVVTNTSTSTHYTRPVCDAQYCLYYLNAKGGWDSFLIEGSSIRTDKIDRHQYNKSFVNQSLEYEKNTYISEITTAWKLNTGILDDSQAYKMCWHLLSSNHVYLHDLIKDTIVPVVVTNTQNIFNTYKNNDHQPIQYEINLVESQTKLRQ